MTDDKKTLKQKATDVLTDHLTKIILGILGAFLLNYWLNSFGDKIEGLEKAMTAATIVQAELGGSVDSLRWQLNDINKDVISKLGDHEARIRDLEKRGRP